MRENTPNMVGVDISKSHLDAHRLRTGEAARFGNDAAGFEELAGWIGAADRVVYEATGRYHRAFEEALVRDRVAALNRQKGLRVALLRRQCRRRLEQNGRQLKAVDAEIARTLAGDDGLARRAETLASIPGVGKVTAAGLLAAMPELGGLDAKAAASLAGLAPVARESGQWQGKRFIQGGRGSACRGGRGSRPAASPRRLGRRPTATRHRRPASSPRLTLRHPKTGALANLRRCMRVQN